MATPKHLVCVGAIAGAFGVRGEVRVKSFTADPEDITAYGPLVTEDESKSFDVTLTRAVKGGFAAKLSGVGSKEAADALKGTRLYLPRERLPEPEDDEFYYADLIGLSAFDPGGVEIGKVRAVHDHGAGDVLELRLPGGADRLVPFTAEVVPTVDIAGGRLVVDLPDET
ncbi:MAG: ribosome maturation factor RimM [Pseudomonadota bacterium]